MVGDLIVGRRGPQQPVEGDPGGAEGGTFRGVARAVRQAAVGRVAGEPAVEQRICGQDGEKAPGTRTPGTSTARVSG